MNLLSLLNSVSIFNQFFCFFYPVLKETSFDHLNSIFVYFLSSKLYMCLFLSNLSPSAKEGLLEVRFYSL